MITVRRKLDVKDIRFPERANKPASANITSYISIEKWDVGPQQPFMRGNASGNLSYTGILATTWTSHDQGGTFTITGGQSGEISTEGITVTGDVVSASVADAREDGYLSEIKTEEPLSLTRRFLERADSLGITVEPNIELLLRREPALIPIISIIVERIIPPLISWDPMGSIHLDSFSDPDLEAPETVRFVVHPSERMSWKEMMAKWDEYSNKLSEIIPMKSIRNRIRISFTPDY